jgi:uncharacterized protein YndB with AHSA1/START domain
MNPRHPDNEDTSLREIVIARTIDAPRALVWTAMTDPAHLVHWWGPRGFRLTVVEMDVRAGGRWTFVMHGPDGTDYPNASVFTEIVEPERIRYLHGGARPGGPPADFEGTWSFQSLGPRSTRVEIRMVFPTAEARNHVEREYGAVKGGRETLERLGEHAATMPAAVRQFVVSRVFDAPRHLVYRAWTEAEALSRWWGPRGFKMGMHGLDLRPGGIFLYSMQAPDGRTLWGKFTFAEVAPPERITFVNSFSDEQGGMSRNPWNPNWPLEVLNTLTLTEYEGRTTLTLRGHPVNASETEFQAFEDGAEGMSKGFGGTLDQLGDFLGRAPSA